MKMSSDTEGSTKKELRKQKKKRKLIALAKLVTLNENDRLKQLKEIHEAIVEEPQHKRLKVPQESNHKHNKNADNSIHNVFIPSMEDDKYSELQFSDADYQELKLKLQQRKSALENLPTLNLRALGERAQLETPDDQRIPLFLTDIQHLIMETIAGHDSPCNAKRWCNIDNLTEISHCVVLIIEGFSLFHYYSHENIFERTKEIFNTRLEVVMPPSTQGFIMEQMAQVPLTTVQAGELIEQYGCIESAIEMTKDSILMLKTIFPVEKKAESEPEMATNPNDITVDTEAKLPSTDKFPRTRLLLSALQMVQECYPLPLRGEMNHRVRDYVFTNDQYKPVTNSSPMFGLDCEMCRTSIGVNELTRVSIVNEKLETVYETLVMPTNKIINYLTPYSGITPDIMLNVTKKLPQVHKEVRELLPPDAILVGQSLNFDLHAMKMMHPYVIDTSVCFNITGQRRYKSKLRTLAMAFLKESIQENADGHDSVEDSAASLKLVQMKLANNIEFGDSILIERRRISETIRALKGDHLRNNLFAHATANKKPTAIVTAGEIRPQMKDIIERAESAAKNETQRNGNFISLYEVETNGRAISKAQELALQHSLTLTNLNITPETLMDNSERLLHKMDKWIHKMWQTVAHNGMFVIMMGGSPDCNSGLVKIAIKKDITDCRLFKLILPKETDEMEKNVDNDCE